MREVGEELGLNRPSLSHELFKCTICTSYNRCVVSVFTYQFDPKIDEIKWQEEEVQWGDFLEYDTVEVSAALSIEQLWKRGVWPGSEEDAMKAIQQAKNAGDTIAPICDWDYVPDGLLVWVAWLQWLHNKHQNDMQDATYMVKVDTYNK
jgi:hypothetical protein